MSDEPDFYGIDHEEALADLRQVLTANGWGSPDMTDDEVERFAEEAMRSTLEFIGALCEAFSPMLEGFSRLAEALDEFFGELPPAVIGELFETEIEEDYPTYPHPNCHSYIVFEDEHQVTTAGGTWGGYTPELLIVDEAIEPLRDV